MLLKIYRRFAKLTAKYGYNEFESFLAQFGTGSRFMLSIVNFCLQFSPFVFNISYFTCECPDPYSEYGSGSGTKYLNTDPIWIRIHNTADNKMRQTSIAGPDPVWLSTYLLPDSNQTLYNTDRRRILWTLTDGFQVGAEGGYCILWLMHPELPVTDTLGRCRGWSPSPGSGRMVPGCSHTWSSRTSPCAAGAAPRWHPTQHHSSGSAKAYNEIFNT